MSRIACGAWDVAPKSRAALPTALHALSPRSRGWGIRALLCRCFPTRTPRAVVLGATLAPILAML